MSKFHLVCHERLVLARAAYEFLSGPRGKSIFTAGMAVLAVNSRYIK
jgi:hypothetical protein